MIERSEFFVPNVINYVRVVFVVLMLIRMRTKPISAFVLCLISGFMDSFDGDLARYLNQKSKLGYIMDMSLDRLTNSAQMVTLALFYPKYWLYFFTILSVDTIRDFSKAVLQYQNFLVDSVVGKLSGDQIKNDIFEKLEITNFTVNTKLSNDENFNLEKFLILQFYHYVWYSSDLYFWLLYFNAFIIKDDSNMSLKSASSIKDINNNRIPPLDGNLSDVIFLKPLRKFLFRKIEIFLNEFQINYVLKKIVHHFISLFRLISFFLFLGAILKVYFNIQDLVDVLYSIVNNDNRLKNFSFVNK